MMINKHILIGIFAVFFVTAQLFFTVLTTHHAFMDMPRICPVCTVASDDEDAFVPKIILLPEGMSVDVQPVVSHQFVPFLISSYYSRAPPIS